MRRIFLALVMASCLALLGCSFTGGTSRTPFILEPDAPGYDYKVYMVDEKYTVGDERDLTRAEVRREFVAYTLECDEVEVVGERFLPLGRAARDYGLGTGTGFWVMKVRCIRKDEKDKGKEARR
jgi:hypothetical protein